MLYLIDSLQASGAEMSLVAMAPHLTAAGLRVDVGHFDEREGLTADLEKAGANVFARPAGTRRARVAAARELVRDLRPDVVHTTLFEADIAGRLAARAVGVPVTSSLVSLAYGKEQRLASSARWWRWRGAQLTDAVTLRLCHSVHALTDTVATTMARRLRLDRAAITVIPRGRDAASLGARTTARRNAARARLGIDADRPLLLCVARHAPPKGLDVAVRAMPMVLAERPDTLLIVAGREGAATPILRRAISTSGVAEQVVLLGGRDDVPDLLVASDALVFPSRWEGFGGTLIEALALRTPIVASDLPVLREVLGGPGTLCGRLVPVGDPQRLAGAVLEVLGEPDLTVERTEAGRRLFEERYDIERVAEAMRAFHESSAG